MDNTATPEEMALREKALNMAIALCEGMAENYTNAYDSDIIVAQARNFLKFLKGESE